MTSPDAMNRPPASDVARALRELSTSPADAPTAILEADHPTSSTRAMTLTSLETARKLWMPGLWRWLIASGCVAILFVIGIWLVTSQIQGAADPPSDLPAPSASPGPERLSQDLKIWKKGKAMRDGTRTILLTAVVTCALLLSGCSQERPVASRGRAPHTPAAPRPKSRPADSYAPLQLRAGRRGVEPLENQMSRSALCPSQISSKIKS
jgi:hypothetical protein